MNRSVAGLLDHPAHRLTRERRELEVPVHVLGRCELAASRERLLGPAERPLGVVELVQPRHDPRRALLDATAPERREAVEQAVEDQHPEEQRR